MRMSRRFVRNSLIAAVAFVALAIAFDAWVEIREDALRGAIGREFFLADGPWGEIRAQAILLHPPAEIFDPDYLLGDGKWYFQKASPSEIADLLRECGLTERQIAVLLPTLRPVPDDPNLVAATPPAVLVLELDPDTRSRLYARLAGLKRNFAQAEPFRISAMHLEDWLGGTDLDPAVLARVRALLWRSGDTVMFSDWNLVASGLREPADRIALLRVLCRKVSLRARLHIRPGQNIDAIAAYWNAQGRGENSHALLQSAASSGGAGIELVELLPPFARKYLNRFPDPADYGEKSPACHWSSFNFFRKGDPDPAFHTVPGIEEELGKNYARIESTPRFGDIILLNETEGVSFHSAVYIADDLVFTKNGPSHATPWVLSTIEDMKAFYPRGQTLKVDYRRPIAQ